MPIRDSSSGYRLLARRRIRSKLPASYLAKRPESMTTTPGLSRTGVYVTNLENEEAEMKLHMRTYAINATCGHRARNLRACGPYPYPTYKTARGPGYSAHRGVRSISESVQTKGYFPLSESV